MDYVHRVHSFGALRVLAPTSTLHRLYNCQGATEASRNSAGELSFEDESRPEVMRKLASTCLAFTVEGWSKTVILRLHNLTACDVSEETA